MFAFAVAAHSAELDEPSCIREIHVEMLVLPVNNIVKEEMRGKYIQRGLGRNGDERG